MEESQNVRVGGEREPINLGKATTSRNLGLVYEKKGLSNYNCYETLCFIKLQARSVQ